jgi:UDP-N-acetylglucosamine acyltransferase
MAYCHVAHDCLIGDRVIMANAATLAGHIDIGQGAIIGGIVGIHQFVRIGSFAIIGAMSGIGRDIPPYVTAAVTREQKGSGLYGLNLIGLKRNRFPAETIAELKKAYRILFRSRLTLKEALARVEAETAPIPEVRHLLDFIRTSKRGVQR